MSFIRSATDIPAQPPVAWKNEPWGRWSSTVQEAFTRDAPPTGDIPEPRIAPENDAEAEELQKQDFTNTAENAYTG